MTQDFKLGQIVATPGVLGLVEDTMTLAPYLARHINGDWGDLDAEDTAANNRAVTGGERILSAYSLPKGQRIWIITEADRSATTILLPEEY